MAELDPNIVLKAFATPQLDIAGTMQAAQERKRQMMLQQRQDSEYAQQQAAQARQMQQEQARRGVVQLAGTDLDAARKKAFELGDPEAVNQVGNFEKATHDRAAEIARGTAPSLLSLRNVPPEGVDQALGQIAPLLQQYGFNADHIEQIRQKLKDPAQRDGFFNQVQIGAQNYAEYAKSQEPVKLGAGEGMFVGNAGSGYKQVAGMPDKPNVAIVEGPNGFYSVDKNTGRASPVTIGGAPASGGAPAGGGYIPPPANLIQTVTGGKGQVGSGFGPRTPPSPGASAFHNGVDVPLPAGTPVNAAADGTVIAAWNDTAHGGGLSVRIRHADGTVTGYADLGGYNVKVGQQVRAGQPIGTAGSSGSTSTGNHVHFSVRGPGGGSSAPSAPAMGEQLQGKPKTAPAGAAGKIPIGYRPTADGNLEPIPGGPADPGSVDMPPVKEIAKRNASYPKVAGAYRSATFDIDAQIKDLEALKAHPGLDNIVGAIDGRLPAVLPSSAAASALLKKILARGQFRALQDMRNNSPTGGALGNVSDSENKTLRQSVAALDQTQGEETFRAAIDQYIDDLRHSKGNIEQAFDDTYAYRKGGAPAQPQQRGPARITNDADFAKLPSGALFIGPDGHVRRKP